MAIEIERKFLVADTAYRRLGPGIHYCQGYLTSAPDPTVRVRIAANQAFLCVKGRAQANLARSEFEYPIPLDDAQSMLSEFCQDRLIKKVRYEFYLDEFLWCVDEFLGQNQGLVLAEVEMSHPHQTPPIPSWINREVTGDPRYQNAYLAHHPFQTWQ